MKAEKKILNVEQYIKEQLSKDDNVIANQLETEKVKIGWVKQLNNHRKNLIDEARIEIKKAELLSEKGIKV